MSVSNEVARMTGRAFIHRTSTETLLHGDRPLEPQSVCDRTVVPRDPLRDEHIPARCKRARTRESPRRKCQSQVAIRGGGEAAPVGHRPILRGRPGAVCERATELIARVFRLDEHQDDELGRIVIELESISLMDCQAAWVEQPAVDYDE